MLRMIRGQIDEPPMQDIVDRPDKPKPDGKIIGTGGKIEAPKATPPRRVISYSTGKVGKPLWEKAGLSEEVFRDNMAMASRLAQEDRTLSDRFREADEAGDMERANEVLTKIRRQNEAAKIAAELRAATLDGDQARIAALRSQAQKYLGA